MFAAFAGCPQNVGLGRFVSPVRGSSHASDRTGDTGGALWKPNEEGNVVSMRKAHALVAETPKKRLRGRGHVLRSVQRPVHVNRHQHYSRGASLESRLGGAVGSVSRSGKPAQAGGTGTEVGTNGRKRGSPRVTASLRRRSCVTRQKRKEVMAFVPARKRELRLVSVRRVSLQKSAGRILVPNKLARSAPKRVAVRVNGGLAGEQ